MRVKSCLGVIAALLLAFSCNNKEVSQPEKTSVRLSKNDAFIQFVATLKKHGEYVLRSENGQNLREITPLDDPELQGFLNLETDLIDQIKSQFDQGLLTETTFKEAFVRAFPTIPIITDTKAKACNDTRNTAVNECWEDFGWNSFWNLLKGPLGWSTAVDNVKDFTNCNRTAEKNYRSCLNQIPRPPGDGGTPVNTDTLKTINIPNFNPSVQ